MPTNERLTPLSGDELRAKKAEAEARYLAIAASLKAEAGVTEHYVCKPLAGWACLETGVIKAPEGRTRKGLYILAHECGHVALHRGRKLAGHVMEREAEQWAHDALRRYGVPVPKAMTKRAKTYVGSWVDKDARAGHEIDEEALRYSGRLKAPRKKSRPVATQTPEVSPSLFGRLRRWLFG